MNGLNFGNDAQYMGPGLGGIMMGRQQRLAEDSEMINQQRTLEEIMRSQQVRDHEAQMMPHKLTEIIEKNKTAPIDREDKQSQTRSRNAQTDHTNATNYVNAIMQYGDLPWADDGTLEKQYGMAPNHPVVMAAKEARRRDAAAKANANPMFMGPPEKTYMERLQEGLAMNDPKSRDTRNTEEHRARIAREANESKERIAETRTQGGIREAQIRAEAKLQEAKQKIEAAKATRSPRNIEEAAVQLSAAKSAAEAILQTPGASTADREKALQTIEEVRIGFRNLDAVANADSTRKVNERAAGAGPTVGAGGTLTPPPTTTNVPTDLPPSPMTPKPLIPSDPAAGQPPGVIGQGNVGGVGYRVRQGGGAAPVQGAQPIVAPAPVVNQAPQQAAPAPRPANNGRMAQSPADFPVVTEQQQSERNQRAIMMMEQELADMQRDLAHMGPNHPDARNVQEQIKHLQVLINHRKAKTFNPVPGL